MKDALGHGSNGRGGAKPSAKGMRLVKTHTVGPHSAKVYKNPEWGEYVVQTFRNGAYQPKNDYHTDDLADAHGTAMSQLNRWSAADGGTPERNNQAAAAALASGPKSGAVPVHDSVRDIPPNDPRVGSRDFDAFGRPRSADSKASYDDYSRDLSLRSRNGQVGSGMRFRG